MDLVLKNILTQYSKKKANYEFEAEKRKQEIYEKYPKLQDLDNKISSLSISTTKALISNNDKNLLNELNKNIEKLKEEKNKSVKKLEKETGYDKYDQRTYDNLDNLYTNLKN